MDLVPTFDNNRWLVLSSEGCPNSWGSDSQPASKCPQAFVDVIEATRSLTFFKLLTDLKLVGKLRGLTAQTIFAPSDEAFSKLPEGMLEGLSPKQAKAIVLRHVLDGMTVPANDVVTGPVDTLGGEKITLIKTGGDVQISYMKNYMNVVNADVMADNGVIHVIDKVIMPPGKFPT